MRGWTEVHEFEQRSEGRVARAAGASHYAPRLSSMPTCLASGSGLLRSSVHPHRSSPGLHELATCASRKFAGCRRAPGVRRAALSTATVATTRPSKYEAQRAHALTVLHKTSALLPRILPSARPGPGGVTQRVSLKFWEDVLNKVHEDLSLSPDKKRDTVRIVGERRGLRFTSGRRVKETEHLSSIWRRRTVQREGPGHRASRGSFCVGEPEGGPPRAMGIPTGGQQIHTSTVSTFPQSCGDWYSTRSGTVPHPPKATSSTSSPLGCSTLACQ